MVRLIPLLEARALSVGATRKPILADIGFSLSPGEVLCLLGPNGTGKTTLFRTLLGLIPALSGQVLLDGRPLAQLSRAEIAARLSHVPQSLSTPFAFRARDLVLMGASARLPAFAQPGPTEQDRASEALAALGIHALAEAEVSRLSGGERQLVLIARAVAQGAQAVLMDEPTASLDFANRIRVGKAIRALRDRGHGVIVTTHDPDQAAELGDRAMLVARGGVLAQGSIEATMTEDRLSQLYGLQVRCDILQDGRRHFREALGSGPPDRGKHHP